MGRDSGEAIGGALPGPTGSEFPHFQRTASGRVTIESTSVTTLFEIPRLKRWVSRKSGMQAILGAAFPPSRQLNQAATPGPGMFAREGIPSAELTWILLNIGGLMIHRSLPLFFIPSLLAALLAGCGSKSTGIVTCGGGAMCPASPQGTVYVTLTDDPPAGVTVLFFQVTLSSATLTQSSGLPVSLLNNIAAFGSDQPPQIDMTQLQAASTFLSTAQAAPGTYSGLSLTFANPQLVIFNQSDSSLGSACAVGSVCEFTPAFDNNSTTLGLNSSPFPVTVSASSSLGLLIDFHLNAVIQPDFSLNLAAANGVTISALPSAPAPAQFGSITGTVRTVTASTGGFTLTAPWGGSFDITTTSATAFNNFPSSACSTPGIGCLAQGQIVTVDVASMAATGYGGVLTASAVDYVQAAAAQTVQGTIIQLLPSNTNISPAIPPGFLMILHANPTSATGFPLGGVADVSIAYPATFSIDSNGFSMPSGLNFNSGLDLMVGQNVAVTVQPGTLSATGSGPGSNVWGPPPSISFTTSAVELEPSQMTGAVTTIDSGTTSFTLGVGSPFFAPWPLPSAVSSYDVMTTGQTSYTGFNPDSFDGLATNDLVSVNGWLFPTLPNGGTPTIAAQSVILRPAASF
jgi:hypothetical protein